MTELPTTVSAGPSASYDAPALTRLGTLSEITLGTTSAPSDDVFGSQELSLQP